MMITKQCINDHDDSNKREHLYRTVARFQAQRAILTQNVLVHINPDLLHHKTPKSFHLVSLQKFKTFYFPRCLL